MFSWDGLHYLPQEGDWTLLSSVWQIEFSKKVVLLKYLFFRLHATRYPDGWDMNGVGCTTDCNTANTCKVFFSKFHLKLIFSLD